MSKHSQPRNRSRAVEMWLLTALGGVVAVLVLVHLVRRVVEFGSAAVGGRSFAWIFTLASAIGALACVLVIVLLVLRGLRALGLIREYRPRRAAARERREP